MLKKTFIASVCAMSLTACGGGGGGGSATSTAGSVTLSGTVSTDATTAAASTRSAKAATRALAGGTVTLYKIFPDGTEEQVDIGTVTTDSSGNYTIPDVAVPATGTGAAQDFYYEVRVSDGSGVDVRAPAAPTADTTVDVNPQTNLAAKVLSDVVDVPGMDNVPIPSAETIEALREQVAGDAVALANGGSMEIPDATSAGVNDAIASANGLASAGGNGEKMYKAVQFEAEAVGLASEAAAGTATANEIAAYLKRVTREGCNQTTNGNPLPLAAASAMGEAFIAGNTYTPAEIVAAFNANNGADPDADQAAKVSQFAALLTGAEEKLAAGTPLTAAEQLVLYIKRDLSGTAFAADTALEADQAVAFLQSLVYDAANAQPGSGACDPNSLDATAVVAELTGDTDLASPAIADVQIYHNQSGSCSGQGHFTAEVDVYAPGDAVTGVTITSSDITALGGDGTVDLSPNFDRWQVNDMNDTNCVAHDTDVTYTVTANLQSGGTVTTQVTRNHPLVPEAATSVDGQPTINNVVSTVSVKRPLYTWESPEAKLGQIANAPAGSAVKYTYEFSHVVDEQLPPGYTGPEATLAGGPLAACDSVNASGSLALYSVDSFMPTVDCDVQVCAAAVEAQVGEPINPDYLICRMNIQTFLVDEFDRILGQAAGHFPLFRVQ